MSDETERIEPDESAQSGTPAAPSLVERGDFDALLDAFCETFGTELCRLGGRQAQLAIAMQEFVADAENQRDAAIVVNHSRLSPSLPLRDSQPSTDGALRWLVHLHSGVGKRGGAPESGEWEDAIEAGKRALESNVQPSTEGAPMEPQRPLAKACLMTSSGETHQEWRERHGLTHSKFDDLSPLPPAPDRVTPENSLPVLPDSPTRDSHPVGGEEDVIEERYRYGSATEHRDIHILVKHIRSLRSSLATVSRERDEVRVAFGLVLNSMPMRLVRVPVSAARDFSPEQWEILRTDELEGHVVFSLVARRAPRPEEPANG